MISGNKLWKLVIMEIKKENYKSIGTYLRCHDSYITGFECSFETHSIQISLSESPFTNIKHISFEGVTCLLLTGFEPWGHDSCIFDWQYIEPKDAGQVFKDVLDEMETCKSETEKELVFSEFIFKSGDKIRIACKSVLADLCLMNGGIVP